MKDLKAYNTEAIDRFHQRKVHNTEVVEIPQDDPSEPPVPDSGLFNLPESDQAIPDDPTLDFVNSQCYSSRIWIRLCRQIPERHMKPPLYLPCSPGFPG